MQKSIEESVSKNKVYLEQRWKRARCILRKYILIGILKIRRGSKLYYGWFWLKEIRKEWQFRKNFIELLKQWGQSVIIPKRWG
jgi:hypothetical protein